KSYCAENEIVHRMVSVESHRSNGRVERVIGTIREGLAKLKDGGLEERIKKITETYNTAYHVAIKCTPLEAVADIKDSVQTENSGFGKYGDKFKIRKREKFNLGQKVRIASHENLGTDSKRIKGRFIDEGIITGIMEKDSYLVRYAGGRIAKKRHYDLKG
ncbi:hypothetical protein ENBRE01_2525, partial [Enteropsectra breve]